MRKHSLRKGIEAQRKRGTGAAARVWLILSLLVGLAGVGQAQETRRERVGVPGFGDTETGRQVAEGLAQALAREPSLIVADRDESRAAAHGAGYAGALSLSLDEAQDLGGALGCGFYFLGRMETRQEHDLARPVYGVSYAALVLVSGRTGRLVKWDVVTTEAASPEAAAELLPGALARRATDYVAAIATARAAETQEALRRISGDVPRIEDVPEADSPAAQGLRLPAPYRRLQPPYPESAARVGAGGTVDVLVELDAQGEVKNVELARWAGFGLDEATLATVRQMHFRPAQRDGIAIPLRVLLRYNFRPRTPPQ